MTAIIAQDMEFYEKLPKLFPFADARPWFAGNKPLIESTAFRNSSLQGAYLIIAARSLGLDCGPMSGFDNAKVDAAFFKAQPGNQTSSATWDTEIPANSTPGLRGSISTRPVKSYNVDEAVQERVVALIRKEELPSSWDSGRERGRVQRTALL